MSNSSFRPVTPVKTGAESRNCLITLDSVSCFACTEWQKRHVLWGYASLFNYRSNM